jgi:hypothetical protein
MTVESVTNIADLDDTYPELDDPKAEGDDHIRNIKTALLTDLPNITGPITSSHTELNQLDGVTVGGTSAGDIATIDDTQTLTNKTINGGAITSGTAKATTSGTTIDFTGIPSWVKKITVMLEKVSTDSTSTLELYIGGSGGIETTGYVGPICRIRTSGITVGGTSLSGVYMGSLQAATYLIDAYVTISLMDSSTNTWAFGGTAIETDASGNCVTASPVVATKSLSGTLTQLQLTTDGADTFDAGKMNILYEG